MPDQSRQTELIVRVGEKKRQAYLLLIILFLVGLVAHIIGDNLPSLVAFMRSTLVWLADALMATTLVLFVSEIVYFREYLEQRLLRADFFERSTDPIWLRDHISEDHLVRMRTQILYATVPGMDEERRNIIEERIYPICEQPWRRDFDITYTIGFTSSHEVAVTVDYQWFYVNSADHTIEVKQPLELTLAKTEATSTPEKVQAQLKKWSFRTGGNDLKIAWDIEDLRSAEWKIKAALSLTVPPQGELECQEHREYFKPATDNNFIHKMKYLTKNIRIGLNHPDTVEPYAYGFSLGSLDALSSNPTHHSWTQEGWFLEGQGVILYWDPRVASKDPAPIPPAVVVPGQRPQSS